MPGTHEAAVQKLVARRLATRNTVDEKGRPTTLFDLGEITISAERNPGLAQWAAAEGIGFGPLKPNLVTRMGPNGKPVVGADGKPVADPVPTDILWPDGVRQTIA